MTGQVEKFIRAAQDWEKGRYHERETLSAFTQAAAEFHSFLFSSANVFFLRQEEFEQLYNRQREDLEKGQLALLNTNEAELIENASNLREAMSKWLLSFSIKLGVPPAQKVQAFDALTQFLAEIERKRVNARGFDRPLYTLQQELARVIKYVMPESNSELNQDEKKAWVKRLEDDIEKNKRDKIATALPVRLLTDQTFGDMTDFFSQVTKRAANVVENLEALHRYTQEDREFWDRVRKIRADVTYIYTQLISKKGSPFSAGE